MRKHTKLEEKKHYVIKVLKKIKTKNTRKAKSEQKKLSDRQDFETHVAVSQ